MPGAGRGCRGRCSTTARTAAPLGRPPAAAAAARAGWGRPAGGGRAGGTLGVELRQCSGGQGRAQRGAREFSLTNCTPGGRPWGTNAGGPTAFSVCIPLALPGSFAGLDQGQNEQQHFPPVSPHSCQRALCLGLSTLPLQVPSAWAWPWQIPLMRLFTACLPGSVQGLTEGALIGRRLSAQATPSAATASHP